MNAWYEKKPFVKAYALAMLSQDIWKIKKYKQRFYVESYLS